MVTFMQIYEKLSWNIYPKGNEKLKFI
jgi:hypothetical protein